jgi:plastocyanin
MRHLLRWRVVPALVIVTALLSGCGDDDDDDDTSSADASEETASEEDDGDSGGEAIEVTAVDYAFEDLPSEIAGGNVTVHLTNEGETAHEIAFINIGEESNAASFFDDFGPVIQGGAPWPDYVSNVAGANEAEAGSDFTATYQLDPGTYMVFCALTGTPEDPESEESPPHFAQGMEQLVTVTEGEIADLPDADGTITARDYEFDVDVAAGDQVITFTNEGPNDHFAGISRFPDGTTVEDAEAAMEAMLSSEEGPPPGTPEPEDVGFSGITSAGKSLQFELAEPLEAGVYSFVCFISDRAGGPPHAIGHQMVNVVEIS